MTKVSYQQTLDYLYSRLPMFTRDGASAFKKDLTNTIVLCAHLDNPQNKFKSVHVGGTNGKGSTSHMLAAILNMAGYKTGLYTSPHLKDFRERIRVNGEMISEESVVDFVQANKQIIEEISPSFFEVTVAMAFDHFAKQEVDVAIIEVGLGGRLDSTNVITPVLSVITNIGYDHMNLLGNTLSEIATEKAGIIKPNVPVVIGERSADTQLLFEEKAKLENSKITFASDEWTVEMNGSEGDNLKTIDISRNSKLKLSNVSMDLTGSYQLKNVKTVLAAVEELRLQGFTVSDEHIRNALSNVKNLTGLQGRWQVLQEVPLVICDTGHNEDGIKEVLKNIDATPHHKLHFVIGMVKDKEISRILSLLPKNATYYFCEPDLPRAKPAEELASEAVKFGLNGAIYHSVAAALEAAKNSAQKDDLIFVGGSTFVVAEVI